MNCVRVSVLIARQHPETLDMGVKKIEKEAPKSITIDEAKREAQGCQGEPEVARGGPIEAHDQAQECQVHELG